MKRLLCVVLFVCGVLVPRSGAQNISFNFNDGSSAGWQTFATGWQVTGGVYRGTNTAPDTPVESVWGAGYGWTDYTLTADVNVQGSSTPSDAEVIFRYQDSTHYGACRFLNSSSGRFFEVYDRQSGTLSSVPFSFGIGTWYTIRATIQGGTARCEVIGQPGTVLTAAFNGPTAGTIGLRNTHVPVWFDNVNVQTLASSTGTINVTCNFPGATFTITGPATYNGSGTNFSVNNAPAGTYTITFNQVGGFITPASQVLTLAAGSSIVFNGQYQPLCGYSLSPQETFTPASSGGDIIIDVTVTSANCLWTVGTPSQAFVIITSGAGGGSTNGSVRLNVAANPGAAARSATIVIAAKTVTIIQAGNTGPVNPGPGLRFVKVEPCRIMETRPEYVVGLTGSLGPPFLSGGETRTLPVPSSPCGIPASARAYVLNVTVVPRPTVDFVTVFPAGEARPQYYTVRSQDGQWVANSAIVKAGAGGAISVFASNSTDMVIDISGYFTDDPNLSNLVFYPLTPCRVIDTRQQYRPEGTLTGFGPTTMGDQATRRFRFPSTPYCQIPQGAAAYSVTITVDPLARPLAFLTAWPASANRPNVSNINSPGGRILANSVILPASADGSIDVFTYNRTDFIMDINGYFAPDNGQGLFYFPVTQCRAGDTTVAGSPLGAVFENNATRSLTLPGVPGCAGIPSTARAYAVNVTATPNGSPMPFITAYPTGAGRPIASILNAFEGQTVSNSAIVPAGTGGAIDIYAFLRTNVIVEVSGFFGR